MQLAQAALPIVFAKLPAGQRVQLDDLDNAVNVPTGHWMQEVAARPENVPGKHASHLLLPLTL